MPNQEKIEEKEIVFKTGTFTTGYVLFPIEEKGEFGDYTAIELNRCFLDKDSLTSFLDEFISFESNDLSIDEQSIILEKFTKYDENYFEKNNLYLISSMNSTPLLELQSINKTFLKDINKYNYIFDFSYSNDYTINGFLQNYVIIEVLKEDQDYINNIEINMIELKEQVGVIGDYAATLEVVENFNVNFFTTNHLMKTFLDKDGYLNGESYENKLLINTRENLDTFINDLNKQTNDNVSIESIKNHFISYDETFFNSKNIYIICFPTSTPAYKLERTEKLSTNIENKYDYILKYDCDETLAINGFVNCFFIIEIDKTISDEINDIKIETS